MRELAYHPGTSIIHKLYPITKFVWLILSSILVFLLTKSSLLVFLSALSLTLLIGIYPRIAKIRGFRLACFTALTLLVLYLIFEKNGRILLNPGIESLTITNEGLDMGLRVSSRFLSIISMSYIFIMTTSPNELAYALMKMGVPYRYGFMLVTALRLAPIMEEEGKTIYKAQLVRGIRYDKSNITKIFLLIQQFVAPLIISALHRADKLVFSMEGRSFSKFPTRTFRNQTKPSPIDLIFSMALSLLFTILILINFGVL